MGFDEQSYKNDFNKKTYKNMGFRLRKEEAQEVLNFIKENTELSNNQFFKEAVLEKIEKMKKSI